MSTNLAVNVALSMTFLGGIVGAGVAVGSGVGMMASAMAEEEKKQQSSSAVAHSVIEKKPAAPSTPSRGFAAGNQ